MMEIAELFDRFSDATVYFVMASVATILFLLRLGLALLFGLDSDVGDLDLDAGDLEVDHGSSSTFGLFSLLSILAFFMGAGWMGLAARLEWGFGSLASAFLSTGFGAAMMFLASGLMFYVRRLGQEIVWDPRSCIGSTGRVYLTIPADGSGEGQVEVSVDGRRKVLKAVTHGGSIAAFQSVRVADVRDDGVLIVEPLSAGKEE